MIFKKVIQNDIPDLCQPVCVRTLYYSSFLSFIFIGKYLVLTQHNNSSEHTKIFTTQQKDFVRMLEIFHSPDSIIWCFPPDFQRFFFCVSGNTNPGIIRGRQKAPPNDDRKRKNSLTVNQNMAVGERWEIRSLLDLFRLEDIMSILIFDLHWPARAKTPVMFLLWQMAPEYGIYIPFICMILQDQPRGEAGEALLSTRTYFSKYLFLFLSTTIKSCANNISFIFYIITTWPFYKYK